MQPHRDVFICLGLKRIPRGRRTRSVMALDGGPPAINPSDSPMDISPRSSAARVLTNLLATSDEAPIAAAPHGFQRRSKKKFACTPTFSDPDRAYEDEGHTSDATDGGQERSSLSNSYPSPDRVAPSPPPHSTPQNYTPGLCACPHMTSRGCAHSAFWVSRAAVIAQPCPRASVRSTAHSFPRVALTGSSGPRSRGLAPYGIPRCGMEATCQPRWTTSS